MHTSFYVSGFLFDPVTQQILLRQSEEKNVGTFWCMLGGMSKKDENPTNAFQRIIQTQLNITLPSKRIYEVYSYFNTTRNIMHYVFYAETADKENYDTQDKSTLSWFLFKQTLKLHFDEETKRDIVVAQRVIQAKARGNEIS